MFTTLVIAITLTTTRYGAALAFLTGESPDNCKEDPTCDQVTFPFWQVAHHDAPADDDHHHHHCFQDDSESVKKNSAYFRRVVEKINKSASDQQR